MVEKTLSEVIAQTLASEIIDGRLTPGAKLEEPAVAARFRVSRTPVRDALRELAATRLIEHVPRRGFTVAIIEPARLQDVFEGLSEIEGLCAGLCALRAGPTERSRIEYIHQQAKLTAAKGDADAYAALNEDLHRTIYACTHNKTLERLALEVRQQLAPYRSRLFFQRDRIETSVVEHAAVIEAILSQDRDGAARSMQAHTARTAMNVINKINEQMNAEQAREAS